MDPQDPVAGSQKHSPSVAKDDCHPPSDAREEGERPPANGKDTKKKPKVLEIVEEKRTDERQVKEDDGQPPPTVRLGGST